MYDNINDGFKLTQVSVPADGSCFFTSISIAMFDSIETWGSSPIMRKLFRHHWSRYSTIFPEEKEEMTAKFIRYMAASAMDEIGLIMHNEEAKTMRKKQFKKPEEFARHILYSNCWADQAIIRSLMKSLQYRLCIVVIDHETRKTVYMPTEWTYEKEFYICVCLEGCHYTPIHIEYKEEQIDMCLDSNSLKIILESCSIGNTNTY
jgi:hypothetical protein